MTWWRALAAWRFTRLAATVAAAGLVTLASVLPVWTAHLIAPQYPKGLSLRAYGDRLEGDVAEINGLNHYIGMRPLDASSIPELGLWPIAIAGALFCVALALLVRGWMGRAGMVGLWSIPLVVLADIQRWLYVFGHDLEGDAALRVGPFTPLAVGPTSVWNFRIVALPGAALVVLAGAAAVVTLARRVPSGPPIARARPALMAAVIAGLTLALTSLPAQAAPSLQALVDAVPAGGELVLEPGTYRGPVVVDRPLTLRSAGGAVVDGAGIGTVITVRASGATIEGLRVRGSGGQLEDGAAISVIGADGVTVAGNHVSNSYAGIRARAARDVRILGNAVEGRGVPPSDAGIAAAHGAAGAQADGVTLWDVTGAVVRDNRIEGVRDGVYLSYASQVLLDRNVVGGSRYGVHAMFGTDIMIFENELRANAAGLVLMYPSGITVARNTVEAHRTVATGYGILLKDVRGARVIDNAIRGNGVALKLEGADDPPAEVLRNEIAYNVVAVDLSPRSQVTLSANTFAANLVGVVGAGDRAKAAWTKNGVGNHWADHPGFDADGDGRSDVAQVVSTRADRLTENAPELRALRGSLAYRVFARAERWVASSEGAVVVDRAPLAVARTAVLAPDRTTGTPALAAVAVLLLGAAGVALVWARR